MGGGEKLSGEYMMSTTSFTLTPSLTVAAVLQYQSSIDDLRQCLSMGTSSDHDDVLQVAVQRYSSFTHDTSCCSICSCSQQSDVSQGTADLGCDWSRRTRSSLIGQQLGGKSHNSVHTGAANLYVEALFLRGESAQLHISFKKGKRSSPKVT